MHATTQYQLRCSALLTRKKLSVVSLDIANHKSLKNRVTQKYLTVH